MKINIVVTLLRKIYALWAGCAVEETIMSWRSEKGHLVALYHGDSQDCISAEAPDFECCVHILCHTLLARVLNDRARAMSPEPIRDLLLVLAEDWIKVFPYKNEKECPLTLQEWQGMWHGASE